MQTLHLVQIVKVSIHAQSRLTVCRPRRPRDDLMPRKRYCDHICDHATLLLVFADQISSTRAEIGPPKLPTYIKNAAIDPSNLRVQVRNLLHESRRSSYCLLIGSWDDSYLITLSVMTSAADYDVADMVARLRACMPSTPEGIACKIPITPDEREAKRLVTTLKSDPNGGQTSIEIGSDGVIRSVDKHRRIIDAVGLTPAQLLAYRDMAPWWTKFSIDPSRNFANETPEDGTKVSREDMFRFDPRDRSTPIVLPAEIEEVLLREIEEFEGRKMR